MKINKQCSKTVKVMLDQKQYKSKPDPNIVPIIVNRLGYLSTAYDLSIQELSQATISGHCIKPALCGKKESEWVEQQVFFIDIDNNITIQQAIEISKTNNLKPVFIYSTFSHTEEHHKFRMVFVTENVITDFNTAKNIQKILIKEFKADIQCKNLNRLYYPGLELLHTDFESRIKVSSEMLVNKGDYGSKGFFPHNNKYISYCGEKNPPDILPNIEKLMKNNCIKAIIECNSEKVREYFPLDEVHCDSIEDYTNYITGLDLSLIFDVDSSNNFNCHFHEDDNPSAGIFKNKDNQYIYHCFACGVSYNIIQIFDVLTKIEARPSLHIFIRESLNIVLKETNEQLFQQKIINENMNAILCGEMEHLAPVAYGNIHTHLKHLLQMHMVAFNNIAQFSVVDDNGCLIFFASTRHIAKETNNNLNNIKGISKKNALFAYHEFFDKIDKSEVPKELLDESIRINTNNGHKKIINYFRLQSYTVNKMLEIEQQGKKWKYYKYSMTGCSREMFFRAEGKDVANRVYPQYKKVKDKSTGEVIDRGTTKYSDSKTKEICNLISNLVHDKGYATEAEVIREMHKRDDTQYVTYLQKQIKKSLAEILFVNNMKRIRTNKQTKKEYNVKGKGYPFIFVNK